jgi:hypothetical protein
VSWEGRVMGKGWCHLILGNMLLIQDWNVFLPAHKKQSHIPFIEC